jgi:hypothetical protein
MRSHAPVTTALAITFALVSPLIVACAGGSDDASTPTPATRDAAPDDATDAAHPIDATNDGGIDARLDDVAIDGADGGTEIILDAGPDLPHLPYDADGWTTFPSDYTTTIYVDAVTGKDSNPGTSPTAPIQTLKQVQTLIGKRATGESLHVLLKRGSVWPATDQLWFGRGGDDASHPLWIDGWNYGASTDPRPSMARLAMNGSHIAAVGVHVGPGAGTGYGLSHAGAADDLLVEDCLVDGYWQNMDIEGQDITQPLTNFRMRRSLSLHAHDAGWATSGESKPQGIYAASLEDALFEENVFDDNAHGFDDLRDATMFGHDIYISNSASHESFDVRIVDNLISRGLQSVKGPANGAMLSNLFVHDGNAGYVGPQGSAFEYNLVIDNVEQTVWGWAGSKISETGGFGIDGYTSTTENAPTTIAHNLFARGAGTAFHVASNAKTPLVFEDNVVAQWPGCLSSDDGSLATVSGNVCQSSGKGPLYQFGALLGGSKFGGDTFDSPEGVSAALFKIDGKTMAYDAFVAASGESGGAFHAVSFPDASASPITYLARVRGVDASTVTYEDFVGEVEKQSKFAWRAQWRVPVVANAIRAGFGLPAVAPLTP